MLLLPLLLVMGPLGKRPDLVVLGVREVDEAEDEIVGEPWRFVVVVVAAAVAAAVGGEGQDWLPGAATEVGEETMWVAV